MATFWQGGWGWPSRNVRCVYQLPPLLSAAHHLLFTTHGFRLAGAADDYDTWRGRGDVGEQDDAIANVRTMQISGRYILGGSDNHPFEDSDDDSGHVDSCFLLDTQAGKHANYASYEALRTKAQDVGITVHLEPIQSVYQRYRYAWFDAIVAALLLLPPITGLAFLIVWTRRVRRTRGIHLRST